MSDTVWIEHPHLGDYKAEVTNAQFELVWKDSGWKRAKKPTKAELEELAEIEAEIESDSED